MKQFRSNTYGPRSHNDDYDIIQKINLLHLTHASQVPWGKVQREAGPTKLYKCTRHSIDQLLLQVSICL